MRIGPYELLEVLGAGGTSTVYRGQHEQTGQFVAVKVLSASMTADPILLRRFEQEYRTASRVLHPHLVRSLDFGTEGGQPYLVLEFIDGPSLGQLVRSQGPLTEAEAIPLILQVADALDAAHRHRLIHRDVKPDNILLAPDGQARLTDLGLIKDLDARTILTRPRAWVGTLGYMAPEQFEDSRQADVRCDVYSLAATLYYAITGVGPFPGPGGLTILQKKLKNDFVPPRRLAPSLPEEIDALICRALDASAERRPASCREFSELLTGLSRPEVVASRSAERRIAFRYPAVLPARLCLAGSKAFWEAEILDVSLTGLCLQTAQNCEPQTGCTIEVPVEGGQSWSLGGQVRWVRDAGENRWRLGCAFDRELTEEQLTALLGNKPPTVEVSPQN